MTRGCDEHASFRFRAAQSTPDVSDSDLTGFVGVALELRRSVENHAGAISRLDRAAPSGGELAYTVSEPLEVA